MLVHFPLRLCSLVPQERGLKREINLLHNAVRYPASFRKNAG